MLDPALTTPLTPPTKTLETDRAEFGLLWSKGIEPNPTIVGVMVPPAAQTLPAACDFVPKDIRSIARLTRFIAPTFIRSRRELSIPMRLSPMFIVSRTCSSVASS